MEKPLADISLPGVPLHKKGKVRNVYDLGDRLLIVATDRISAFDFILPSLIPGKGKVLTQLSSFWFGTTALVCSNHLVTAEVEAFPAALKKHRRILDKRSMLVRKTSVVPIECVVRGYLAGSGWKEYKATGKVCGIKLPKGLVESDQLPEAVFTPSTKAEVGHDENISFREMEKRIGSALAQKIRKVSLELYHKALLHALNKGIIIADTKFEFGLDGEELVLIDEIFTPDSSRFWPLETYAAGRGQPSLDKQFVRDYLESTPWDKTSPPPPLPAPIVRQTAKRYLDIYKKLTGRSEL
ncbi:MAG: phosphoribosylaminoimidazolesuccinocarboxamide synthase [Candidatus Aminicenantes bacterium]|nr:phosphoribosylaminoimidazolesuccinocarboxamide synthase [Candidatus Aminicenantes bacterium]